MHNASVFNLISWNFRPGQIWFVFPFSFKFIIIDEITNLFEKRVTFLFIFVFVVIQNTITVHIDNSAEHELYFIFEINDICHIGQEAV